VNMILQWLERWPRPETFKLMAICAGAGPAIFALLFCLNMSIIIFFFDTRVDRPASEYVIALTAYQGVFFVLMYVGSWLAFACLALWLLLIPKIRVNAFAAAVIFIPVMTFINCKIIVQYDWADHVGPPPPLVFGSAVFWEFPLRGFLAILTQTAISAGICGWLVSRSRVLVQSDDTMKARQA
jgi:hypothetical protein